MRFPVLLLLLFSPCVNAIACAPGFTCYVQSPSLVWVIKNVTGANCAEDCSTALCGSGTYYACDSTLPAVFGVDFNPIATGLGFSCKKGACFNSTTGQQAMWVSVAGTATRSCYFPVASGTYDCSLRVGNANCYGERYSLVCPCAPVSSLEQACPWKSPPQNTAMAKWSVSGTTCLARINYWRQKACADKWPECPPCGLPPMVECVSCHECANSQADYDSTHGAHASFTRCGDMAQGEGGGSHCASVIDAFVAERQVFPDSNGLVVCRGHCGPIVSAGCQTFFWGRSLSGFYTLNWGTCDPTACNAYCSSSQTQSGGVCRTDNWSVVFPNQTSLTPKDGNANSASTLHSSLLWQVAIAFVVVASM